LTETEFVLWNTHQELQAGRTEDMEESSPYVSDATMESFEQDVIVRSQTVPVVVDFWAEWCQPCKQLAPLLEKLAAEYGGKFRLVKVNIEEAEQLAAYFRVSSIPYVLAFRDGQPVNEFQGLLPEESLREWLGTFLPSPAEEAIKAGLELESDDPPAAELKFREAAELDSSSDVIRIHLARVLLAQKRDGESRQIIDRLEERGFLEPEAEKIKAELDIRAGAAEAGGVVKAREAVEANPDDLSLKVHLADALVVDGRHEQALDICLKIIEQDKMGVGVEAKETMVKIFELLGPASELTSSYRRRLSTLLY
jgi:putative thioredoxin